MYDVDVHIHIYMYIYIERERERERESITYMCLYTTIYMYIDICIYILRPYI
jgi:hypothetical protein